MINKLKSDLLKAAFCFAPTSAGASRRDSAAGGGATASAQASPHLGNGA